MNWTSRTSDTFNGLNGVCYIDNTFVTVGGGGTILTSPNGSDLDHPVIFIPVWSMVTFALLDVIRGSAPGAAVTT